MKRLGCTLVLLALAGCNPSTDDCSRLLDHFLDVEGAASTSRDQFEQMTPRLQQALAEEKLKFRGAIGDKFSARCQQLLSRSEVRCALDATDEAAMDRCEGR